MRDLPHDFLFSKGLFVGASEDKQAPAVLTSLAKLFNISITSNPGWAHLSMVEVAKRNLGMDVPRPFYQKFPQSVKNLSLDKLVLDRLLHYMRTYTLGDFSRPGHSVFEEEVVRKCFDEKVEVRELAIIGEGNAIAHLEDVVGSLLTSTRPLNDVHYNVVRTFIEDYGYEVTECNCKDTVVGIDMKTREFVWLNVARDGRERVAGETGMGFLLDYLEIVDIFSVGDFARLLAGEVVDDPGEADVVFSDRLEPLREGAELIRSCDTEHMMELLH